MSESLADRLAGCLKGRSNPWRGYRAVRVKDIREAAEALRRYEAMEPCGGSCDLAGDTDE